MLKILKASAGSGKTYNLAREYIRLVVGSDQPDAYRHVLAVTFTNKATDEMKRRILKELYVLSKDPQQSPYVEDLVPAVLPDIPSLQKRAARQLSGILNDYSAFAVSTIDRFFQQTLRAFSREIGQFASYQVQVDRESLLTESVDRVLDALSEKDTPMLDWLTRSAQENLQEKGKIGLEDGLQKMAKDLYKVQEGEIQYDKEAMDRLRKLCTKVENAFPEKLKAAVNAILEALESVGVAPEDTNRGFLKAIRKNLDGVEKPSDAFVRNAQDPDSWFAKAKAHLLPGAHRRRHHRHEPAPRAGRPAASIPGPFRPSLPGVQHGRYPERAALQSGRGAGVEGRLRPNPEREERPLPGRFQYHPEKDH